MYRFILTELEAIAKDITAMVEDEKALLASEEKRRQEQEERRKHGEVAVMSRRVDPNKFMPEMDYLETRLHAVKEYLVVARRVSASPPGSPLSL